MLFLALRVIQGKRSSSGSCVLLEWRGTEFGALPRCTLHVGVQWGRSKSFPPLCDLAFLANKRLVLSLCPGESPTEPHAHAPERGKEVADECVSVLVRNVRLGTASGTASRHAAARKEDTLARPQK